MFQEICNELHRTPRPLRSQPGTRLTTGLDDATLTALSAHHPQLIAAVDAAAEEFARVQADLGPLLAQDEQAQIDAMQDGFVNFYADDAVTPYVALAARGPWVVTLKGAVLYDAGGYGMLGFGHTPDAVLEAMARPQVMANIMTPACRSSASSLPCAPRSATAVAAARSPVSCA